MSKDKKRETNEDQLSNWLDGKLSDKQASALRDAIETSAEEHIDGASEFNEERLLQQRMNTAQYIEHQAGLYQDKSVPNWDRGKAFVTDHQPWWQWRAIPALSLAFSMFAIALVLFKVELVYQPEGLMLTFASSNSYQNNPEQQAKFMDLVNKEVDRRLDVKLTTFASEQQVILANYAADIKVKQQDNNLQLASYVMGASRQERKEDMSDFINYINDQRVDEKFEQTLKYDQLEQAILTINSTDKRYKLKNANLITEE